MTTLARKTRHGVRLVTGWPLIIIAWVAIAFGLPLYRDMAPTSKWFVINQVYVYDAVVGDDPLMYVDRELRMQAPILGRYYVKVLNARGRGVCHARQWLTYTPRAGFPRQENLRLFGYWMGLNEGETPARFCNQWPLPPGRYCVETLWRFYPDPYPVKNATHEPACFKVRERRSSPDPGKRNPG